MVKRSLVFGLSLILGWYTFAGQIILLRELFSVFPESELVIGIYFTLWMLSTGAGALVVEKRKIVKDEILSSQFIWLLILLPLALLTIRILRIFLLSVPGEMPRPQVYLFSFLCVIPFSFLGGFIFGKLSKLSKNTPLVYGADALGSFLAATILYLVLFGHLSPYNAAAIVLLLTILSLTLIFKKPFFLPLLFLSLILYKVDLPLWKKIWAPFKVVKVLESRYGRLTLTEYRGIYSAWENASKLFVHPTAQQEKLVFLTVMNSGKKVLLVGGGGRALYTLSMIKGINCVYVEPNKEVVNLSREVFSLFYNNTKVIYQDARSYLRKTEEKFSALILDLPPPTSPQMNRFFTKEFFLQARKVAKSVALTLEGGSFYSKEDAMLINSIYKAMKQVFPTVVLVPGEELLLIGSKEKLKISPSVLSDFLRKEGISPRKYTPFELQFETLPFEYEKLKEVLQLNAPANSDTFPASYIYGLQKWIHHYFPGVKIVRPKIFFIAFVLLIFFICSVALKKQAKYLFSVAVIGLVTLASEIILLVSFQYSIGYLYREISLLLGLMMLAMGIGSLSGKNLKWVPVATFSMLLLYASVKVHLSLPEYYFLFGLLGFSQGAVFSRAASLYSEQTGSYSAIYFWDLFFASFAGLFTTIFILPFYGFKYTLLLFFLLSLTIPISFLSFRKS